MPYSNVPKSLWPQMESCTAALKESGHSEESAIRICYASVVEGKKMESPEIMKMMIESRILGNLRKASMYPALSSYSSRHSPSSPHYQPEQEWDPEINHLVTLDFVRVKEGSPDLTRICTSFALQLNMDSRFLGGFNAKFKNGRQILLTWNPKKESKMQPNEKDIVDALRRALDRNGFKLNSASVSNG